jgi:hypothetical protein
VIRDELHLRPSATATRAAFVTIPSDAIAGFAAPLTRERLYGYAPLHVDANDLDIRTSVKLSRDPVVIARGCPWSARRDHCRPNAALVEGDLDCVVPLRDPPYSALQVGGLTGQ